MVVILFILLMGSCQFRKTLQIIITNNSSLHSPSSFLSPFYCLGFFLLTASCWYRCHFLPDVFIKTSISIYPQMIQLWRWLHKYRLLKYMRLNENLLLSTHQFIQWLFVAGENFICIILTKIKLAKPLLLEQTMHNNILKRDTELNPSAKREVL